MDQTESQSDRTRYQCRSKPPPGLARMLAILLRETDRHYYPERGLPNDLALRAFIKGADRLEYCRPATVGECMRFLRNTRILLCADGTREYYDPVRGQEVLKACGDHRDPPFPEVNSQVRIAQIIVSWQQERDMRKAVKRTEAERLEQTAQSTITHRIVQPPPATMPVMAEGLDASPNRQSPEVTLMSAPSANLSPAAKTLPVWVAYLLPIEFEILEYLRAFSSNVEVVEARGTSPIRVGLSYELDNLATEINKLTNLTVTSDDVVSVMERLANAGVIKLKETGQSNKKSTYEVCIPFDSIFVKRISQRPAKVSTVDYAKIIRALQSGPRVIQLNPSNHLGKSTMRSAEFDALITEICPGVNTHSPKVCLAHYRLDLPGAAESCYGNGWGILLSVPEVNPSQALVALPGFEALDFSFTAEYKPVIGRKSRNRTAAKVAEVLVPSPPPLSTPGAVIEVPTTARPEGRFRQLERTALNSHKTKLMSEQDDLWKRQLAIADELQTISTRHEVILSDLGEIELEESERTRLREQATSKQSQLENGIANLKQQMEALLAQATANRQALERL